MLRVTEYSPPYLQGGSRWAAHCRLSRGAIFGQEAGLDEPNWKSLDVSWGPCVFETDRCMTTSIYRTHQTLCKQLQPRYTLNVIIVNLIVYVPSVLKAALNKK